MSLKRATAQEENWAKYAEKIQFHVSSPSVYCRLRNESRTDGFSAIIYIVKNAMVTHSYFMYIGMTHK